MSFDNSRFTFNPRKDYSGVVMEQGRVQTDADWNEWLSEISRRIRAGTLDTMGHAVYPATTPNAFQIAAGISGGANTINIGVGRMYVDGILVENHGKKKTEGWDSALDELSNTPQPASAPPQPLGSSNSIDFSRQPYSPGAAVPAGNGQYLAYLDVWQRPVTYIEDPSLVDVAIGVDTSGRVQTAWRVGLMPGPSYSVAGLVSSGTGPFVAGEQVVQDSTGATANLIGAVPAGGPMTIGPITGGTPDGSHSWKGQSSAGVFAPAAAPSGSNFTVTGSVTSGTFVANEQVTQANTGATANLVGIVTGANPMYLGTITGGTPDDSDTWVGQSSHAIYKPSAAPALSGWSCSTPDSSIPWPASSGRLTNGTAPQATSGPCCLTTGSGYTGVENQFYRVEIHVPGGSGGGGATFKWSRENASVQTGVTGITSGKNTLNQNASVLTVQSLGRDQVLGFSAGNWIEITNQTNDDNCQPGELYKIDKVDVAGMSITLTTLLSSNYPASSLQANRYTRITRWDQAGKIVTSDSNPYYNLDGAGGGGAINGSTGIPVPPAGTRLLLENGITVEFDLTMANGNYLAMDYWNFSARTADGSIDHLHQAPPRGIYHHYTKLSVVTFGATPGATDCRQPWAPTGGGDCSCCCSVTVGQGGTYSSIQQAIQSLPPQGGEVCILPGKYYEYVLLQGLKDVVIHGCGWQTHVISPGLQSGGAADNPPAGASASESGLTAIFTLVDCHNIEMRSFSVSAADEEIGILLDRGTAPQNSTPAGGQGAPVYSSDRPKGDINVIIKELRVSASTLPAVVTRGVKQLEIANNQISMADVEGRYAAVYLSGDDMFFVRNQVSLSSALDVVFQQGAQLQSEDDREYVVGDRGPRAPGGIQIAGPSKNIFVEENEIKGGSRNGITLGNFIILDENGDDNGTFTGLQWKIEDKCGGGGSGSLPPNTGSGGGTTVNRIAAGGMVRNLHIDRNLIHKMGMCGIGPVGFFNWHTTLEVISLVNIYITENIISNTLQNTMQRFKSDESKFGYGAICLPDVRYLTIRDNTIVDYGVSPGAEVCGIFVLHGEGIEISRNQVRETRDLSSSGVLRVVGDAAFSSEAKERLEYDSYGGMRAGIYINLATPPTLDSSSGSLWGGASALDKVKEEYGSFNEPMYAPGLPSLRIQENQVRVALGMALSAMGTGPFSIVNNHFSSGGPTGVNSDAMEKFDFSKPDVDGIGTQSAAMTVGILNLGLGIDALSLIDSFTGAYSSIQGGDSGRGDNNLVDSSSGAVLFTNNICQLETRANNIRGYCSVGIMSLDHVLFGNNHLWLEGRRRAAMTDAMLFGMSVQATSNRLQESPKFPVIYSGIVFGLLNITSLNLASYCIKAKGFHDWFEDTANVIMNSTLCRKPGRVYAHEALNSNKDETGAQTGDISPKAATEQLDNGMPLLLSSADSNVGDSVQGLGQVQQSRLSQFTRQAAVAVAQYGASSKQADAAQATVTATQSAVSRINVVQQQVATPSPAVPADGWTLHGRVYDNNLNPLSNYSVFLVDGQKNYLSDYGFAYTDSSGYFNISYSGSAPAGAAAKAADTTAAKAADATAAKPEDACDTTAAKRADKSKATPKDAAAPAAPSEDLYLQVADAKANPVYLSADSFQPATGKATYQAVTLPAGAPPLGDPPADVRAVALPPKAKKNAKK